MDCNGRSAWHFGEVFDVEAGFLKNYIFFYHVAALGLNFWDNNVYKCATLAENCWQFYFCLSLVRLKGFIT